MRSQVTLCVHWGDEILGHSAWAKRDFHSSLFQSGGRKPKTSWTSRRAKNPKSATLHWRCRGLNSGPHTCEACALPLSYIPLDETLKRDIWANICLPLQRSKHDLKTISKHLSPPNVGLEPTTLRLRVSCSTD